MWGDHLALRGIREGVATVAPSPSGPGAMEKKLDRETPVWHPILKCCLLVQIIEEELHAQTLVLESLNMNLCNTQMELQKEKAAMGHLEKTLQIKLAEAEDKYKYTIQLLTEENIHLRQKIIAKNEEIYEGRCGKSADSASLEDDLFLLEGSSSRR